ncbi:MAG: hypothetical protein KDM64_15860, partial [Verrucomicrobiae bacterium]|nr:hypothetical protein [Verrucomicrobiae bacterium]
MNSRHFLRLLAPLMGLIPALSQAALPSDFDKHVAAIRAVGPEGAGNEEAAAAFQQISGSDAEAVLPLLRAMESSGALSRNWLRSAIEVIVQRELKAGKSLPVDDLKAFLLDTKQSPEARRFAFDLVSKIDPAAAEALVPGFLNDPSTELRRDAVALLITEGKSQIEKADNPSAITTFRKALD